jgi:ATP-dependent DNA ligase
MCSRYRSGRSRDWLKFKNRPLPNEVLHLLDKNAPLAAA